MPTTRQLIEEITDPGHFEGLATACLREMFPICDLVVQTGVNAEGKTIQSPVDGVGITVLGGKRELVAIHHTTSQKKGLRSKWLGGLESDSNKPIANAEMGDVAKAAEIFASEKEKSSEVSMTLFLTVNKEPSEDLIRDVARTGETLGFDIIVVAASRFAHFLDTGGKGHWLRKQYLGVEQELLSRELLTDLCSKNLTANQPPSAAETWIPRELDEEIGRFSRRGLSLLVGESGIGKSVACFRELERNLSGGGFSLVVSHESLEAAPTIDAVIFDTLKALHPNLSTMSSEARGFASASEPLLILVEDLNESASPAQVLSKLLHGAKKAGEEKVDSQQAADSDFGILCPVWPSVLSGFDLESQNRFVSKIHAVGSFDDEEGALAVKRRADLCSVDLSNAACAEIAEALGNDPLLIALHDLESHAAPEKVLSEFVEKEINKAAENSEVTASDFRLALNEMAEGMMTHGSLRPFWREIASWDIVSRDSRKLLSILASRRHLFRLAGHSTEQRIRFRHDRVREYVLVECCLELEKAGRLEEALVADPFFAEVMGLVILEKGSAEFLGNVSEQAPLAVASALRSLRGREDSLRLLIVQQITDWLTDENTHTRKHAALLNEARTMIGMSIGPEIPELARLARGASWSLETAAIRNGSFEGGLRLFQQLDPGMASGWIRKRLLDAVDDHSEQYSRDLASLLEEQNLRNELIVAALRFAGLVGTPSLNHSISACWASDADRIPNLKEYVWAVARCFDPDDFRTFDAVVEAWATLPDDEKENEFTKSHVSYGELNFAFCHFPLINAIPYLIAKASEIPDLDGCICQLLHGVDSPDAVFFVAESVARRLEALEGTGYWNPILLQYSDKWRRADEDGRPMSETTRMFLREIWEDPMRNKFLRIEAFKFWKASNRPGDNEILRQVSADSEISDKVFWERLLRGDGAAIPYLIEKLGDEENFMWWQCASEVSSAELTSFFSRHLAVRSAELMEDTKEITTDDFFAQILRTLEPPKAEQLLIANWDGLKECPYYVESCLYIATEPLIELALQRIEEHEAPSKFLEHFSFRLGLKFSNRPGLTRRRQATAMLAVSEHLNAQDLDDLRKELYRNRWYDLAAKLSSNTTGDVDENESIWQGFDSIAKEDPRFFLEDRINELFETVPSREQFFDQLFAWAESRNDYESLSLLASVLAMKGIRIDLPRLLRFRGTDTEDSEAIIEDTTFAVMRASSI